MVSVSTDDNAPVGLRHWLILATVQITTLTFGMTITAANVVLPQLKGAMSATPDQIAWVVTFNLVATAIATPLTGWLAQTLGWRNLLFVSITGFTIFSGSQVIRMVGSLGFPDSRVAKIQFSNPTATFQD